MKYRKKSKHREPWAKYSHCYPLEIVQMTKSQSCDKASCLGPSVLRHI